MNDFGIVLAVLGAISAALFAGWGSAKGVGMGTFYVNSNISPQGDKSDDAMFFVKDFKLWC